MSLDKNFNRLIESCRPRRCSSFHVNKNVELEKGAIRQVEDKNLKVDKICNTTKIQQERFTESASILSKFDVKYRDQQIQIAETDMKLLSMLPFGHCELNDHFN